MREEMIAALIGKRVSFTYWASVGEGEWKEGFTEYGAGVRNAHGVKLVSASEIGVVVESTGSAGDGERYFLPWSAVIMISPVREE